MFLISVFELSNSIEEAITALEISGIPRRFIEAVPLDSRNETKQLFDTAHYSDGLSTLALPFIVAMLGTFFGIIYGFLLRWGPVLWGFIGALAGFAVGFAISLLVAVRKKRRQREASKPHVVVIVQCQPDQVEKVEQILWTNAAIGVKCLG